MIALLETVTYDMCRAKGGAVRDRLAAPIVLLKYQTPDYAIVASWSPWARVGASMSRSCWRVISGATWP